MSNPVIAWAKENPLPAGAAALGVVVVAMMLFGGESQAADTTSAPEGQGLSSYYLAVSNQAAAGAAVQIEQIKANAGTNQALIAASYGIEKATIEQPAVLASIGATRDATMAQLASTERMHANEVNLANSTLAANTALGNAQLAVQQNIAFKQANVQNAANKRGFIGGLFSTIVGGATSILSGGTSTLASRLLTGGKAAVPAPTGGTWV